MLRYFQFLVLSIVFCVGRNAFCWQDNKENEQPDQSTSAQEQFDKDIKALIDKTDVTIPDEVQTPALPKRPDIQFGTSDERIVLPLFQVDARLVELKFAAQVDLLAEPIPGAFGIDFTKAQRMFPDPRIGIPVMLQRGGRLKEREIQIDGLSELLQALNEHSTTQLSLDEFRDKITYHFTVLDEHNNSVRWIVLGANKEETQLNVQLLLQIYDVIWLSYQQRATEMANQRNQTGLRVKEFSKSCDAYNATLGNWNNVKDYDDISDVSRTDLKTQRQLTDVDLAGINAKIIACEKLLEKLAGASADEVIRIKTTAEIDLVEKTARRAKLDDLIKKSELRAATARELRLAGLRVKDTAASIRSSREALKRIVEFQQRLQPMPVMNSPVKIRPLEWRNVNQ